MDDSKSIKSNINSEMKLFEKFVDETVFSDDESLFPNNSDYENSDDSSMTNILSSLVWSADVYFL